MEIWLSGLVFVLIPAAFFFYKPIIIHAHFVLHLINIDGEPDTAYAYGKERLTVERFTGWTGYHTYDPRGSVSKGVANAANMISENVSHAVKNKVKDLMETAVKASVMIVCSDTVQLLNDVGNTIFSFIIGTVYGALEPASVLLDFLIDSGGYDSAAFELGRIVGNAAAVAAIFGMFFAGGGAISGAFMGGAMALSLGAAGAATVELAAGATVIAAKGNSIAEALNSLISEMSGASNSGGKGTEKEGEVILKSHKKRKMCWKK